MSHTTLKGWKTIARRFVDRTEWIAPGATCPFCCQPAPTHYADCFIVYVKSALAEPDGEE